MSSKTKIVVLHMKELLYTSLFAVLGIILVVLLFVLFLPGDSETTPPSGTQTPVPESSIPESSDTTASIYMPGIYNTELVLNDQSINVEVIVDSHKITSLQLVNLNEAIETMYPLLQPTFDSLTEQILEKQSVQDISYSQDSRYTSLVLLEAISKALEKAQQ